MLSFRASFLFSNPKSTFSSVRMSKDTFRLLLPTSMPSKIDLLCLLITPMSRPSLIRIGNASRSRKSRPSATLACPTIRLHNPQRKTNDQRKPTSCRTQDCARRAGRCETNVLHCSNANLQQARTNGYFAVIGLGRLVAGSPTFKLRNKKEKLSS